MVHVFGDRNCYIPRTDDQADSQSARGAFIVILSFFDFLGSKLGIFSYESYFTFVVFGAKHETQLSVSKSLRCIKHRHSFVAKLRFLFPLRMLANLFHRDAKGT